MLVEITHGLGVVGGELLLWDVVHPRADQLAQQLPPGLAADRLGDDADRVAGFDEAECHREDRSWRSRGGNYAHRTDGVGRHRRPATGYGSPRRIRARTRSIAG